MNQSPLSALMYPRGKAQSLYYARVKAHLLALDAEASTAA